MFRKEIKVEWCENWIKKLFQKKIPNGGGIETGLFWRLAEETGLWKKGTFGSPMSKALENLTTVEIVSNNGKYCYSIFKLI